MTKEDKDKLILESLEITVKLARMFYPDAKQFSMCWIGGKDGEEDYLQINNPYYNETLTEKKLDVRRKGDEIFNDFI